MQASTGSLTSFLSACLAPLTASVRDQQGLAAPAQALFLRLFQRRGPWFQARTFSYSEVEDSAAAVQQLVEAGLARTDASADSDARSQIAGAELMYSKWIIWIWNGYLAVRQQLERRVLKDAVV